MEHKMRRFKQQLTLEESIELLKNATSGVLSLCGRDGMPYGVPLSHVYQEGRLIFHSALSGHKVDLIRENPNACFTIIALDEIHPERFTTYFKSVIAQGKIHIIEDLQEKIEAARVLGRRCNPNDEKALEDEIHSALNRVMMFELTIDRLTGKQAIELVNR